jgi:hypothetical protein
MWRRTRVAKEQERVLIMICVLANGVVHAQWCLEKLM